MNRVITFVLAFCFFLVGCSSEKPAVTNEQQPAQTMEQIAATQGLPIVPEQYRTKSVLLAAVQTMKVNYNTVGRLEKEPAFDGDVAAALIKADPDAALFLPKYRTTAMVDSLLKENPILFKTVTLADANWDRYLAEAAFKADCSNIFAIPKSLVTAKMLTTVIHDQAFSRDNNNVRNLDFLRYHRGWNAQLAETAFRQNNYFIKVMPEKYVTPEMYRIALKTVKLCES